MKKIFTGTYKLYRKNAAGEFVFVKNVDYSYIDDQPKADKDWKKIMAARDAADKAAHARDCELFEALADAACEQESFND